MDENIEETTGGEKMRLQTVKNYLNDMNMFMSIKCIHSISSDLKRAITCSQTNSFGRGELQQVEDARMSLDSAVEVCQEILQPTAEYVGDDEYHQAQEAVLKTIVDGVGEAMKRWDIRVKPTIMLFKDIETMKPKNWITDFY